MANTINITNTSNTVTITPQNNNTVNTSNTSTSVSVTQGSTSVVTVNTPGPQGQIGPQGISSEQNFNLLTGSLITTASYSSPTLTFTKGDGSQFDLEIESAAQRFASALTSASISDGYITFHKGDDSTLITEVNNVTSSLSSSVSINSTNADNVQVDFSDTSNFLRIVGVNGLASGKYSLKSSNNELLYRYRTINRITGLNQGADELQIGGGANTAGGIFLNSTPGFPNYIYADEALHLFADGYKVVLTSSIKEVIELHGNITASNNISASGNIYATEFHGDGSNLTGISVNADTTALNVFTGSIQTEVDSLTAATSSYITEATNISSLNTFTGSIQTEVDSLTAATSSYITEATNISSLNTFTGSIQTEVDSLTAATSSYLTTSPFTSAGITGSWQSQNFISSSNTADVEFRTITASIISASNNVKIGGVLSIPGFTNVSTSLAGLVAGGDNLGNHTATEDLNLDNNNIKNIASITSSGNISSSGNVYATGFYGDGSNLTGIDSVSIPAGTYSSSLQTLSSITASGDISASGDLFSQKLTLKNSIPRIIMTPTSIPTTEVQLDASSGNLRIDVDLGDDVANSSFGVRLDAAATNQLSLNTLGDLTLTGGITSSYVTASTITADEYIGLPTGLLSSSADFATSAQGILADTAIQPADTASFLIPSDTSSLVTNSQTGSFLTADDTGSLITSAQTSSFLTTVSFGDVTGKPTLISSSTQFTSIDSVEFKNITASGNISASGNLILGGIIDGNNLLQIKSNQIQLLSSNGVDKQLQTNEGGATQLYYNGVSQLSTLSGGVLIGGELVVSNITSSGNISSSGNVYATEFHGDGSNLTGISTNADTTALNTFTGSIQTEVDSLTAATSSYITEATNISSLNTFTSSIQTEVDSLTAATSSYITEATNISSLNTFTGSIQTEVDSLTAATSSYITEATNISSLNTFTGSIQTEVDSLTAATSSYLTDPITTSSITNFPTEVSRSAAQLGFGSGGGFTPSLSTDIEARNITASGDITASGNILTDGDILVEGSLKIVGSNTTSRIGFSPFGLIDDQFISGFGNQIIIDGDNYINLVADNEVKIDAPKLGIGTNFSGQNTDQVPEALTVEGNISSSGDMYADTFRKNSLTYISFTEAGSNTIRFAANGTKGFDFSNTLAHFNPLNGNIDFRIDGDVNDNLFFVDAGTEKIGIGTNTPGTKLEVLGDISASGNITATEFYGDGSNLTGISADTTTLNTFTGSIQTEVDSLTVFTGSIQTEVDSLTAATSSYLTETSSIILTGSFVYFGEEQSALATAGNGYVFSYGNGATGTIGIPVPFDVYATKLMFQAETHGTDVVIKLATGSSAINAAFVTEQSMSIEGTVHSLIKDIEPVLIRASHYPIFKVDSVTGTYSNVRVGVLLEYYTSASGVVGPQGPQGPAGAANIPSGTYSSSLQILSSITASGDISASGTITANQFIGDGSNLTGISADTTALNTFTGSIQTEVNSLTAATSSYITSSTSGVDRLPQLLLQGAIEKLDNDSKVRDSAIHPILLLHSSSTDNSDFRTNPGPDGNNAALGYMQGFKYNTLFLSGSQNPTGGGNRIIMGRSIHLAEVLSEPIIQLQSSTDNLISAWRGPLKAVANNYILLTAGSSWNYEDYNSSPGVNHLHRPSLIITGSDVLGGNESGSIIVKQSLISSSGNIYAAEFHGDGSNLTGVGSSTIPAGTYSSSLQILSSITASGDISASGEIVADSYRISGKSLARFTSDTLQIGFDSTYTNLNYGKDSHDRHSFFGAITASGAISSSGEIVASSFSLGGQLSDASVVEGGEELILSSSDEVRIKSPVLNLSSSAGITTGSVINPYNGYMIYDNDQHKFFGYANGSWVALH